MPSESKKNLTEWNPAAGAADRGELPRVALIGISGYGRQHLGWVESAADRGLIRLVAVVVINREQEQAACARLEARGTRIYESWLAMLEAWRGKLDLCLAPLPIHLHAEVAIAAMEAGANVLVEKPLAATEEQARAIREAERRTGRWVAVGYQESYTDATRSIAAQLAAGRIGRVTSIRWLGLGPRAESYYRRNAWAGRISVDGQTVRDSPLNNAMAHFLNLAFQWAWAATGRKPEPVEVGAELFRANPIENFDTAVVRVKTAAGVEILSAVSHCCPVARPAAVSVYGETGELHWTHGGEAVWVSGGVETERVPMTERSEVMDAMFGSVLARLSDPTAVICSAEQAMLHVSTIEALSANIRQIDETCYEKVSRNGDTWTIVENIEEDLRACVDANALPSEIGAAWAAGPSPASNPIFADGMQ